MTIPATISSTTAGRRSRGARPSKNGAANATATTISRLVKWTSVTGLRHPAGGSVTPIALGSEGRAPQAAQLAFRVVISTNQFKNGTHIDVDGTVFRIVEFQHVKPGKGGAFVRSKLKRVDDGAVIDKTFKAGEKFRPVRTETRKMQFLYDSGDAAVFMDNQSYDQVEIPKNIVGDALKWVPPNSDVDLLFVDERPAGAQPPSAVDLAVTQTDPGLKGDTASGGGNKPATLETGVIVQVPLFIEEGERVRVDTRSGEYVSRA
jgi:elongation factor P